ncbi:class I SAM-dependent methyltransferase [Alkalimonas sp.]|uniref:class I SAM-dependent methyltransferase n=1 Tax=Alkalimonas sp. TaxID=1872453 RepID=UPI00263B807B|nr:class I SAM-dependent methyltransferase [Alkalimonas sp.]MCC5825078.1 class I SAM-dependent methyltransferase [Alkalimonas sp.]
MSTVKTIPSWQALTQHDVFPEANHDEVARMNVLTHLNYHLSARVLPGVKQSYEQRVKPAFVKAHGREPESRHEIRQAMQQDSYFQFWSALRRNTMEMRHQAGRAMVLRQIDRIVSKVDALNQDAATLQLDDSIPVPDNIRDVDIHCQPGCYYTEYFANDVTVAASYDAGLFVTTAGLLGALSDGGGKAIANWLAQEHPGFKPRKILDIGCTIGHNIVPLAQAFPDAEVIAVDVARPSLRYAHARAKALGVNNITFVQANAEHLPQFANESFDLITTAMFWHETSHQAMPAILRTIERLLKPGGLTLHLEQPQYQGMGLYEQFIRDWDTYFNNEPYWGPMHDLDLKQMLADAGFQVDELFDVGVVSKVDEAIFGKREAGESGEDYGRAPVWNAFGLWKK